MMKFGLDPCFIPIGGDYVAPPPVEPDPQPPFDPEVGLVLTQSYASKIAISDNKMLRNRNGVFACDFLGLDGSSGGLIWEQGGQVIGSYVGFRNDGSFIVRTGNGGAPWQIDTCHLQLEAGKIHGDGTLVVEIGFTTAFSLRVWWNGKLLASAVNANKASYWAGTNAGGYLALASDIVIGEVASSVSYQSASNLRYYANQLVI